MFQVVQKETGLINGNWINDYVEATCFIQA